MQADSRHPCRQQAECRTQAGGSRQGAGQGSGAGSAGAAGSPRGGSCDGGTVQRVCTEWPSPHSAVCSCRYLCGPGTSRSAQDPEGGASEWTEPAQAAGG